MFQFLSSFWAMLFTATDTVKVGLESMNDLAHAGKDQTHFIRRESEINTAHRLGELEAALKNAQQDS